MKLIEPTNETSPIYKFALRGGGLHHLCFKTDDIHTSIQNMNSQKCMTISLPQPGEAFENENIAFLLAPGNLNIELIDTDKRAGIINTADNL
ncbi:VOC family protein [Carboxylicivirga linearis]|uniref:VOC family protein n=1 Tax=Carboxylicivirga linearis TaxID=1628157 RepID=A0ABS5K0A9_9BACT|nr:VOC family protein [Carboxylicivirga linearis]